MKQPGLNWNKIVKEWALGLPKSNCQDCIHNWHNIRLSEKVRAEGHCYMFEKPTIDEQNHCGQFENINHTIP